MEDNDLAFGEDCIIKLQDLGEFKDYSETMQSLKASLQLLSSGNNKNVPKELWQIIEADPQDTYFLPDFQNILQLITSIAWRNLLSQEEIAKIISFYFTIVEQSLLSCTFGQDIVDSLIKEIAQYKKQGYKIQRNILKLLFNLSSKVIYIDELSKVAVFWDLLNEQQMFNSYQEKNADKIGAVYAQCCEKFIRNRELRNILSFDKSKPFMNMKKAIWQRNMPHFLQLESSLQKLSFYNSEFLVEMWQVLKKQINDI